MNCPRLVSHGPWPGVLAFRHRPCRGPVVPAPSHHLPYLDHSYFCIVVLVSPMSLSAAPPFAASACHCCLWSRGVPLVDVPNSIGVFAHVTSVARKICWSQHTMLPRAQLLTFFRALSCCCSGTVYANTQNFRRRGPLLSACIWLKLRTPCHKRELSPRLCPFHLRCFRCNAHGVDWLQPLLVLASLCTWLFSIGALPLPFDEAIAQPRHISNERHAVREFSSLARPSIWLCSASTLSRPLHDHWAGAIGYHQHEGGYPNTCRG